MIRENVYSCKEKTLSSKKQAVKPHTRQEKHKVAGDQRGHDEKDADMAVGIIIIR